MDMHLCYDTAENFANVAYHAYHAQTVSLVDYAMVNVPCGQISVTVIKSSDSSSSENMGGHDIIHIDLIQASMRGRKVTQNQTKSH